MHHGATHDGKHDGGTTCKLRNAFPASDAALFAQSGGFGILPGSTLPSALSIQV